MRRWLGLSLLGAFLVSCRTSTPVEGPRTEGVGVFLESHAPGSTDWVLPQSRVHIACDPKPLLDTSQIAGVDIVTLELGKGLLLRLTTEGVAVLNRSLEAKSPVRLVLVVKNAAQGIVRLEGPVQDGRIVLFVEMPESELPALVEALKPSLASPRRNLFRR